MFKSRLVGRTAMLPNWDGEFTGDWGTIVSYDGYYYYIAFAGDENNVLIFERSEFKIRRERKTH